MRLQPIDNSKVWKEGTVKSKLHNRTFEVESNGKKYVRNRRLLRAAKKFTHDVSAESVPTARVPSTPRLQESLNTTESHNAATAKNAEPPAVQPLPVTPRAHCTPRSSTSHHTALESTTQSSAQTPTSDTTRTPRYGRVIRQPKRYDV